MSRSGDASGRERDRRWSSVTLAWDFRALPALTGWVLLWESVGSGVLPAPEVGSVGSSCSRLGRWLHACLSREEVQ